jgi:hypothetical protein
MRFLLEIDSNLEKAEGARRQLENDISGGEPRSDGYELPEEALVGFLESAATQLSIAIDLAGLTGTQAQFVQRWQGLAPGKDGIGYTQYYSEVDSLDCPALTYLETLSSAIRLTKGQEEKNLADLYEVKKLELMLKKIPLMLVADRVVPQSEKDYRDVAHKYLEIYFTYYTRDVQIPGAVRPFKPDAGVINLKAAIEFKFATDIVELHREIGEVFEDTSGYANSLDWTSFYFVLYQAKALISRDKLKAELDKAGRKNWSPILVSGDGTRKTKT